MYALAIWDVPHRKLILARDRMGQKPLLYHSDGRRLVFASELKRSWPCRNTRFRGRLMPLRSITISLMDTFPIRARSSRECSSFLPHTSPSGMKDRSRSSHTGSPDWNLVRDRPLQEDVEELRTTLEDAVLEQMISDVPLGAFLSGGIDSTIIAGLMQKTSSRPVKTFAIGFPDPDFDETSYAALACAPPGHRASDVYRGTEGLGNASRALQAI